MHFPTFAELPDDYDLDLRYYDDPGSDSDGITEPIKHWCLLAEIVQQIPHVRPVFSVRDKADERFTVGLFLGSRAVIPQNWARRCRTGDPHSPRPRAKRSHWRPASPSPPRDGAATRGHRVSH